MRLVCANCGSASLIMRDMHGWVECRDCGHEDHAIPEEDYEPSEAQQGLIPIPEGYAEQ